MVDPHPENTIFWTLMIYILIAISLPVLAWGIYKLKPGKKLKIWIIAITLLIELLLLFFVSYTLESFVRGVICMASGVIPSLIFIYISNLYMYRIVFPARDQYITDFFNFIKKDGQANKSSKDGKK
jgi:hypothetical protein